MYINISGVELKVKPLFDDKSIKKGIQGLDSLHGLGYLFFLNEGEHTFWMKDCLIPIDIIFLKDKEIVNIYSECQPCEDECERYTEICDMVLEVEAGFCERNQLEPGDKLNFLPL